MSRWQVSAGDSPVAFTPQLAKGQAVDLTVEGFGERVFKGSVARLAPVAALLAVLETAYHRHRAPRSKDSRYARKVSARPGSTCASWCSRTMTGTSSPVSTRHWQVPA